MVHRIIDENGKTSSTTRTKIFIINVADPLKLSVIRSVEIDGTYFESRRIDNHVYLLMYQNIKDAIPKMLDSADNKETEIPCNKILIDPRSNDTSFLAAAAIPLNDLSKPVHVSAISRMRFGEIYSSKNNLYIASYFPANGSISINDTTIYKFELRDGLINYSKKGTVPGKVLNQFSMDEHNDYLRVATSKTVNRVRSNNLYILNPNMEIVGKVEHIAPTETIYSARFLGDRSYMVTYRVTDPFFVLDLKDPKNPKVVGQLKIPGFSNYLQPYDENHIIGFGNETEVMETLENPDGGEPIQRTQEKGLKVSIFDVTDVNNPKELSKEVIGSTGTTSDVLNNHKALLFDKEKSLLAFLVVLFEDKSAITCSKYTYSTCPSVCQRTCVPSECTIENGIKICKPGCDGANSCQERQTYSYSSKIPVGVYLYVYHIDLENGLQLRGKITHFAEGEIEKIVSESYSSYGYSTALKKMIQIAFYISENLYTVSPGIVKANKLSDLTELKAVELSGGNEFPYNLYQID